MITCIRKAYVIFDMTLKMRQFNGHVNNRRSLFFQTSEAKHVKVVHLFEIMQRLDCLTAKLNLTSITWIVCFFKKSFRLASVKCVGELPRRHELRLCQ
jgi:hypothetical protein